MFEALFSFLVPERMVVAYVREITPSVKRRPGS